MFDSCGLIILLLLSAATKVATARSHLEPTASTRAYVAATRPATNSFAQAEVTRRFRGALQKCSLGQKWSGHSNRSRPAPPPAAALLVLRRNRRRDAATTAGSMSPVAVQRCSNRARLLCRVGDTARDDRSAARRPGDRVVHVQLGANS